jgi:N-formylglutamate deformylase
VQRYWQPYHDALRDELAELKAAHGHAVLFDAHSIKSELPWLFEGTLPHLNVGTVQGRSCAATLRAAVAAVFESQTGFSHVVDGRFKGGHITRHFGQPAQGVHTVQLEMCWRAYMDETPPYRWHEARAAQVTPLLRQLVQALLAWRP